MSVRIGTALALALSTWSVGSAAFAATDIRDEPGGKRLLFIDGNDVRTEPGGKRLLFIDGNTVRKDGPGGDVLLVVDGNDVRTEAGGKRVAFLDGNDVRDEPGGKRLIFLDGKDVRDQPGGKRLLFIDGDPLTKPQLVAVLSVLGTESKIEVKPGAAGHEPGVVAEADPTAALAGTYKIGSYTASDGGALEGDVVFKKGKAPGAFSFEGPGFKGAAMFLDDNLLCCNDADRAAAALLEKDASGDYAGSGVNSSGSMATMTLKVTGDDFALTAKEKEGTGQARALKLKRVASDKTLEGDIETFKLVSADGEAMKIYGTGFVWHDKMFIGIGRNESAGVVKLRIDGDNVMGDFVTHAGVTGKVMATKQ